MAMRMFHGSFANALIEGLCFLLVGWGRDIVAAQGTRQREPSTGNQTEGLELLEGLEGGEELGGGGGYEGAG